MTCGLGVAKIASSSYGEKATSFNALSLSLSLDEQSKLTDDLERNDRNKYGINPPPTGGPLRCSPL